MYPPRPLASQRFAQITTRISYSRRSEDKQMSNEISRPVRFAAIDPAAIELPPTQPLDITAWLRTGPKDDPQ